MPDLTTEFGSLLSGRIRLPGRLDELRTSYKSAKPFPNLVLDNLFSADLLDSLLAEMAKMEENQWVDIDQDPREKTVRMRSGAELGTAGESLLSIVHSAAFLYLLSEITDIWQLLPDPYLQGSGYALMRRGDHFSIHADRSVAYDTGLTRRLAMIIFLNKSWKPEYAGQLELWNSDVTRCERVVEPLFNKTIIFEVAHPNYHGVPTPLACPIDRVRQSFILYYHTAGVQGGANVRPHTSIFAPRFYGPNRFSLRSIARDITPPIVRRAFRRLTKSDQSP